MLEVGLYAKLSGDAGVSALVGTRIYPLLMPQEPTLPAIVYQRISTVPLGQSHQGGNHLNRARMQLACHATTILAAKQLAQAVWRALDGDSGTWSNVTVQSCLRANELDGYEPEVEAYRVTADYLIVYEEL